jgi:hypothetical protein
MKLLIWTGSIVAAIGAGLLAVFVIARLNPNPPVDLNGLPEGLPALWAVMVGSLSLAIGSALVGIGVGQWQHPRSTHTLPLGQTRHGTEV